MKWKTYITTANTSPYCTWSVTEALTAKTSRATIKTHTIPKLAASRSDSLMFHRIIRRTWRSTWRGLPLSTASTRRSCSSLYPSLKRVVSRPVRA